MGNTIQIKRGAGAPANGVLAEGELGIDLSTNTLYVGKKAEDNKTVSEPITGRANSTKTTLIKPNRYYTQDPETNEKIKHKYSATNRQIIIRCSNLVPGQKYTIELYTLQRAKGTASKTWRHHSTTPPPEDTRLTGHCLGYRNILLTEDKDVNRDCPAWMQKRGVLQTEWEITATGTTTDYVLNLNTWILDLLKPNGEVWSLMGISRGNALIGASRLFQFRVRDAQGNVGQTESILSLGAVTRSANQSGATVGHCSIRSI